MYPKEIQSQNISLRLLEPTLENATVLSKLVRDNALALSSVFAQMVQAYETPAETLMCLQYDEECRLCNQMLPYYIFNNNELAGEITAEWHDKEQKTEIMYWLDKKYVGKGCASDALKLMEKVLFRAGHQEIRLYIDAANWRSADVAVRNTYQLSDCTTYYFKTLKMYRNSCMHICRHEDYSKYFGKWRCLFR